MMDLKSIFEQIDPTQHQLPQWQDLNQFVGEFHIFWRELGNLLQQQLVQAHISQTEARYHGARTKRPKRYYTPLGEMVIQQRYLYNNQTRIDYQSYRRAGLMIGSGVVESSNRRVVTQRLKQAGMHWSKKGAEGVMALRALYLSSAHRWSNFWSQRGNQWGLLA